MIHQSIIPHLQLFPSSPLCSSDPPQTEADRPRLHAPLTTPSSTSPPPPPPPTMGPSPVAPATRRPSGLRTQRRRLLPATSGGTRGVSEDRRQQEEPLVGAGTPGTEPGRSAPRAPEQGGPTGPPGPLRPLMAPGAPRRQW